MDIYKEVNEEWYDSEDKLGFNYMHSRVEFKNKFKSFIYSKFYQKLQL